YVALAFVIAFHSSLQHEIIHGHPTRWPLVNEALVAAPLGFSFPFRRYRDTHLAHHQDARLTDPYDDPESWYIDPSVWIHLPTWMHGLLTVNNSLFGRMALGPGLSFVRFVFSDARAILKGDREIAAAWALHLAWGAPVLALLIWAEVSLIGYALASYAGLSLINMRSFLEHRAEDRVRGRSAIVEGRGLLPLLYLNNNLHAVHHAHPTLPWASLPSTYRKNKERFLAMNGGYVFPSYWSVIRNFGVKPKEPAPHPNMSSLGR
ncbi:MAG: fatty acid desaturase, partial [Pseudomonadota bacterium]